jgi:hypothetical protein
MLFSIILSQTDDPCDEGFKAGVSNSEYLADRMRLKARSHKSPENEKKRSNAQCFLRK